LEIGEKTMNEETKCPNCRSTNRESGTILSTGRLHFRPEHVKFLKLKTANLAVKAHLCMDCGHISLTADPAKARALTDQELEASAR
jgi:predicted nucleic-acid-binding Zn-ribbon protein